MQAYCYCSAYINEPDCDAKLRSQGAEHVWIDCGDRVFYHQLTAEPPSQLLLLRLVDLGTTFAAIAAELSFWQQQGSELLIGGQSSQDPTTVQRWLVDLPTQVQSRRMAIAQAKRRLEHLPPPGKAPFGYRRHAQTLVPVPREASLVKAFFSHFLLYGSLRAAVRHLETTQQHRISISTARRWLFQPVYRGDRLYSDGTRVRDTQVALISRTEGAQIDRWLQRNRSLAPRAASAPYALTGLVRCRTCSSTLRIVTAKPYLYLRCPTCRYSHAYDRVHHETLDRICHELPERLKRVAERPRLATQPNIQTLIDTSLKILNTLPDLVAQGVLDATTASLRRYQLEAEIAHAYDQRDRQPPSDLQAVAKTLTLPEFWTSLSAIEQRNYLREFLDAIAIDAEGTISINFVFDPH